MIKLIAILSTTVLPLDGTYSVQTVGIDKAKSLFAGVLHFIGHPATKEIVENLGAIQSPSKLFLGLQPGESALSCRIKQGQSNRVVDGFNSAHQEVSVHNLDFRIITRAEICGFCGQETRIYPHWHCAGCGAT
jgi:hypothetical protein